MIAVDEMTLRYYVADAFTEKLFGGNPAGVCPLDEWIADDLMQAIAAENNLAETAFVVKNGADYDLRWFTPEVEVDLCGHATLATAFILSQFVDQAATTFTFHTKSGPLRVGKQGALFEMDFPSRPPEMVSLDPAIGTALGANVLEMHRSRDLLIVLESEAKVRDLQPDLDALMKAVAGAFAFIVTAQGDREADFVSRFFAPGAGIAEDPVTGSSHSTLIPFWSKRLGKKDMIAHQLSKRGGVLYCRDEGMRVKISGYARLYLEGVIHTL